MEYPKEIYRRKQIDAVLRTLLNEEKPDVVICYEMRSMLAIADCGYDLNRVIVMFHNDAGNIMKQLNNKQKEVLRKVKYIQVLMKSDLAILQDRGYKNCVWIGNIVPVFDVGNSSHKEKVIIHIGRLDKEQKRQHILINAFSKISASHPDWKVMLFGGDSRPIGYEQELKNLIGKNNLEKQVFLMGKINSVEMELAKASIFAFPSKYEGFGLALTEAMSAGLSVIGFRNCPAVNELIKSGKNGMLCEDNEDSLAKALEILINDEKLRSIYGKVAQQDMKQYEAEVIYGKWENLLVSI